jgi:hypothetical protein
VELTKKGFLDTARVGRIADDFDLDRIGSSMFSAMDLATRSGSIKFRFPHLNQETILWGFTAVGIVLRLRQYLSGRSLWLDECLLALNILQRSPTELLKPLDYHQGAPLGFLMLEKTVTLLLGSSELALRLVPFLAGILSLILFAVVARRFLTPAAASMGVLMFAVSDPLIYYSAEAKQYSSDVAVAILLILLATWICERPGTLAQILMVSVSGALALWFAQPVVFILAAVWLSWLWDSVSRLGRSGAWLLSIPAILWAVSLLIFYIFSLRGLSHDTMLLDYWQDAFAPFPRLSLGVLRWYSDSFFGMFSDPVGLSLTGIAGVALVAGLIELYSENRGRFILLLAPFPLTLIASALHRYPFRGRLLLFLVPSLILLIAYGLERIQARTRGTVPYLSFLLIGFLLFQPVLDAGLHFRSPRTKEEIKPALQYLGEHQKNGDVLYIYYSSVHPFQYYRERLLLGPIEHWNGIESRADWKLYKSDLDRLRGRKRVWILFSHVYRGTGVDEERLFLDYLDGFGRRMDSLRTPGASVYLYDFSNTASP